MSKIDKNKFLPECRFPEFTRAPKWEQKKLGDLFLERQETGFIELPLLSLTEKDGIILQEETNRKNNSSIDKSKYLRVCIGDIAYNTMRMWEGRSAYVKLEGLVSPAYTVCIPKDQTNGLFFSYYFKTLQLIQLFHKYSQGLVKDTLNLKFESFSKILVLVPSPNEQQKIADCLSYLDECITIQSQKLDSLKAHRKGLLQQLFPAEGELMPSLRFKEFDNGEVWEKLSLKDLYTFKVTNSYSREKLNYDFGAVKNIHYGDIHTKFSTLFDVTREIVPYINTDVPISKIREDNYCKEGDIVFADASEDLEDVGKSIELINLNKEKVLSGLHTLLARPKGKKFVIGFGGYLFKSNRIRNQIKKESQGTKVLSISYNRLSDIEIIFPKNKKEQQKITDCLSSIDELIEVQNNKIEALKMHKKGLMQKLFPTIQQVN